MGAGLVMFLCLSYFCSRRTESLNHVVRNMSMACVCLDQPMNRLVLADIVGYMESEGASNS